MILEPKTGGPAGSRRQFLSVGAASALATALLPGCATSTMPAASGRTGGGLAEVVGQEHWVTKRVAGQDVRLWIWNKRLRDRGDAPRRGVIVFTHGSSVSSTPVFDLVIDGRPESSTMDWFARRGFDTWCFDCEGYGRSDKSRPVNADIANGADDLEVVSEYIMNKTGGSKLLLYGSSSGALRAGLFAQRRPERVARLALDALVWTGEGSPTLAERKKRLPAYLANNRRPVNRDTIRSIFTRDHPGTSDQTLVEAFTDAVLALDTSMPNGTYIDMSANLPVLDPLKIRVPVLIMRGEYDGIASFQDLTAFFARLPNADKQLIVMPGIAHTSTRSKNFALVYHLMDGYFSQPAPVYTGG